MKKHFLTALISFLIAAPAGAQILLPQDRGFIGLLLGHTNTTDANGRMGFGAEGGLVFTNDWSAKLYFLSSSADVDRVKTQIDHYGLGVDYRLSNLANGLGLGARLGQATANVEGLDAESKFSYGLALTYDRMIGTDYSIGGEAQMHWNQWETKQTSTYLMLTGKLWL